MSGDLLSKIADALDRAEIPYMLTGSFAGSFHGSPRATQDIDLVVDAGPEQVRAFVASLPRDRYYADESAALEAQRQGGSFNVIDQETGWKVDLIFLRRRPFSATEFDRRMRADVDGSSVTVVTAEDLVLAKLEWAKMGESGRQVEDAAAILRVRHGTLDLKYLRAWVRDLKLAEQWATACAAAGIPT